MHQQYTYTAYDAAGCNSVDALDSTTFEPSGDVLKAESVTATTATLKLENHTGNWWFKRTAPDEGNCTAGEADFTNDLTGLIPGTEYTYKAYDVDTCANTHESASATFTTSGVSVSNLGAAASQVCRLGGAEGFTQRESCANAFTTGTAANGYTLHSITAKFIGDSGSPGDISIALHTTSGNNPSSSPVFTADFSGSNPVVSGDYTYICSGIGCDLNKETTYFIVVSAPNAPTNGTHQYRLRLTSSTAEDKTPSDNVWSIANNSLTYFNNWSQGNGAAMMKVSATVNP